MLGRIGRRIHERPWESFWALVAVLVAIWWVVAGLWSVVGPECRPSESLVRSEDDGLVCVMSRQP